MYNLLYLSQYNSVIRWQELDSWCKWIARWPLQEPEDIGSSPMTIDQKEKFLKNMRYEKVV